MLRVVLLASLINFWQKKGGQLFGNSTHRDEVMCIVPDLKLSARLSPTELLFGPSKVREIECLENDQLKHLSNIAGLP